MRQYLLYLLRSERNFKRGCFFFFGRHSLPLFLSAIKLNGSFLAFSTNPLPLRGDLFHKFPVQHVAAPDPYHASQNRKTEQAQISNNIEHLVSRALLLKTQPVIKRSM